MAEQTGWERFNRAAAGRPSRELLRRALGLCALSGREAGVAVDLGCGAGADTMELLRRGWTVHAVDADGASLRLLSDQVGADAAGRLHVHASTFERFVFPRCHLVWAGFALPFCPRADWPAVRQRIVAALEPGGRFAGDFFGDRHAFAQDDDVAVYTEPEVRSFLGGLEVEAFDIEDGVRPSGGAITRWHAFGVTARKPGTPGRAGMVGSSEGMS